MNIASVFGFLYGEYVPKEIEFVKSSTTRILII